MPFSFSVPTAAGIKEITVENGASVVFVGANGCGKTRLAVRIESTLNLNAHRISAHRALTLNPAVPKISEREALTGLRTGYAQGGEAHRPGHRWQGNAAGALLNDFDFLVQALFADQARKSLETHRRVRAGDQGPADPTKFEVLGEIWQRLLPNRQLHISGDDIEVVNPGTGSRYPASAMSDGERAIFYMIGQALSAANDSLLIFDEPELHVHRSIMAKLWDELEAARSDCAFVFITHDLEFAATRVAKKFIISEYDPAPTWDIDEVPENTGFSEEVTTLILGSRRPILFVEGDENSLDAAIYRCCYPEWTVIARGSCEEVIHSVVTMRRNQALTRVTCSGIVDADAYQASDIEYLALLSVAVLPVSEIENVILLPEVSRKIAETEGYEAEELDVRLAALRAAIYQSLNSEEAISEVVARYCRRRIDRQLKKVDLSAARTVAEVAEEYRRQTSALDIDQIAAEVRERIVAAVQNDDLPLLLANYDNKGLLACAATHLKRTRLVDFEGWLTRVLRNNKAPALVATIKEGLPQVRPA
ncbi:AAA family ATPase [Lysobacter fragariae]